MVKIVAVFDGLKFSEATLAQSLFLAKNQPAHLVGLFMEDFTYQSFSKYKAIARDKLSDSEIAAMEAKDEQTRKASRERFIAVCQQAGVEHSVHKDSNVAFQVFVQESIYADMVIIDPKETFTPYDEEPPTNFIREVLAATECPVFLVPDAKPVEKAVLLFDGSPNSVYAIKQFSYVMNSVKGLEIEVLTVTEEGGNKHLPDNRLMKEFMKRHFPAAAFRVIQGKVPEIEIIEALRNDNGKSLVVLGAYKRGLVSRWFKESMADTLMRNLKNPLFIAHG